MNHTCHSTWYTFHFQVDEMIVRKMFTWEEATVLAFLLCFQTHGLETKLYPNKANHDPYIWCKYSKIDTGQPGNLNFDRNN